DAEDVLAHEDLTAGEAHLEPGAIRKRAFERLERQFLAPLAFEVQQIADVAELAMQIAPHRRFVDDAGRQRAGASVFVAEEALDAALVAMAAIARPGVREQRHAARPARDRFLEAAAQLHLCPERT